MRRISAICAISAMIALFSTSSTFAHGLKESHPHVFAFVFTEIENVVEQRNSKGKLTGVTFTAKNMYGSTSLDSKNNVRFIIDASVKGKNERERLTFPENVATHHISRMSIALGCAERKSTAYASVHVLLDEKYDVADATAAVYTNTRRCN